MSEIGSGTQIPVIFSFKSVDKDGVMGALKKENSQDVSELEELEFDVGNDWRSDKETTKTDIFKEEDLEPDQDDLDITGLSLDLDGEIAKKSVLEHAKEQAKKNRAAHHGKKDDSETLKALQEAAAGEGDGSDGDDMEILTEDDKALVNDPIFNNKGHEYPQIHGNYFLLDHLVDGGMAKVCRARYLGEGDEADKMVAIKMVQEKFSEDEDFVQMFIDEIKVSFGLNHPNINTTFDYGKIGKNLFVSMEYIHGKDLMDVIDELKEKGKTLPVPMCIFIASKMCEALHYAHNFTNKLTGKKYNIVHRDISPHNAMVSYEGYVKVIDFGIAKADTNSQKEEEGTVKGKINYFAPEYLEGKKIDHRYDQFAVALTLWEMLTGDKTFTGHDQISTLKTILKCEPKLASSKNKEVPKELDKIIMKALSRDPSNRYKDMQDFNKHLMKTLYQLYPDFHESDIADLMTSLFKSSYEKDLEKFKEFGQYSISDIVEKIQNYKEFQKRQKEKAANQGGKSKEVVFDFGFEEVSVSAKSGKKGIDSLIGKRKKAKKPGNSAAQKNMRKEQKALAAMLKGEDDDDYVKPNNPLQEHRSLIFMALIIAIGFFQKEAIKKVIGGATEPVQQVQTYEEEKPRRQPRKVISKKNNEFLKKLKNKRKATQKEDKREQLTLKKKVTINEAEKSRILEELAQKNRKTSQAEIAKGETTQDGQEVNEQKKSEAAQPKAKESSALAGEEGATIEEELGDTEAELARLKAQMNALLEKKDSPEEAKAKEEKKKAEALELQRSLASKLDELEEEEEPTAPIEPEKGTVENVLNFIKSRKAFSWMFD